MKLEGAPEREHGQLHEARWTEDGGDWATAATPPGRRGNVGVEWAWVASPATPASGAPEMQVVSSHAPWFGPIFHAKHVIAGCVLVAR